MGVMSKLVTTALGKALNSILTKFLHVSAPFTKKWGEIGADMGHTHWSGRELVSNLWLVDAFACDRIVPELDPGQHATHVLASGRSG